MLNFFRTYFSPLSFLMLSLYIFLMYNAQETLLPTHLHSAIMYGMIMVIMVSALIKSKITFSKFTIWYLIFLILCFISAGIYYKSDLDILFDICVSLIISFCVIQVVQTTTQLEALLKVYVFSSLIMSLLLWFTGQLDYLLLGAISEERLGTEITGNANIFTALFMYSGVFAAWLTMFEQSKFKRMFYLVSFCLIILIMIISGGRKTILAVLGALGIFVMMKEGKSSRKLIRNTIFAILSILAIFIAIFNIPFLYDLIGERFEGLFSMFSGKGSNIGGDDVRKQIFILAIKGWLDNPMFGHGIDSFKFYNQSITGHFYYAHNNFAELLYDIGIIGFVAFYWIYIHIYKRLKFNSHIPYKYHILGYGLIVELLVFDIGGVSYYLVGNIIILSIAYLCTIIKTSR